MFFDGYEQYMNKSVNPALLWEYDLAYFDFNAMQTVVVQSKIKGYKFGYCDFGSI